MTRPRHLIINPDELRVLFNIPLILLSEKLEFYKSKDVVLLDRIIAKPFTSKFGNKNRDLDYLQEIETILLKDLCQKLNIIHDVQYGERYWSIIIRPWLNRCLIILFNRFYTIDEILRNYNIASVVLYHTEYCSITELDFSSFCLTCENSDFWNQIVYSKVIEFFNPSFTCKKENISKNATGAFLSRPYIGQSRKRKFNTKLKTLAGKILTHFSKEDDAVIINTYLPKKEEIKLQLFFRQLPQFYSTPEIKGKLSNKDLRKSILLKKDSCDDFESFVRHILPELIPICYLEEYKSLVYTSNILPWPSKPKFIFVSNMFDDNEVFKFWVANKILQGVPYFIGQHGSNYGTGYGTETCPEQVSCDKFITWGWTNGLTKNISAFNLKISGLRKRKEIHREGILLIERGIYQNTPYDAYHEFYSYVKNQFIFYDELSDLVKKKITVRLHLINSYYKYDNLPVQWMERFPYAKIDTGLNNIRKLTSDSKLVVHSYDSTGILETLALNIPTLAFWENGLDHLNRYSRPYYQMLVDAGIIHLSAESAANKVNEVYDDVEKWWTQKHIQYARVKFCEEYSRKSDQPAKDLKQIIFHELNYKQQYK